MLAVEDLSRTYGETVALDGATVSFTPGTIHAILGENGSGKSTLVKLLSGVVPPTRGAICVDGSRVERFSPATFQSLGLGTVFQEVLVAPDRTAQDNIFLGGDGFLRREVPRSQRSALAAETLASIATTRFDLQAAAGRLPLAAQQLIVLARALVRRPRILILDEVTAALDFADREIRVPDNGALCARRRPHPFHLASHGRGEAPCRPRHDPSQRPDRGHARPRLRVAV